MSLGNRKTPTSNLVLGLSRQPGHPIELNKCSPRNIVVQVSLRSTEGNVQRTEGSTVVRGPGGPALLWKTAENKP